MKKRGLKGGSHDEPLKDGDFVVYTGRDYPTLKKGRRGIISYMAWANDVPSEGSDYTGAGVIFMPAPGGVDPTKFVVPLNDIIPVGTDLTSSDKLSLETYAEVERLEKDAARRSAVQEAPEETGKKDRDLEMAHDQVQISEFGADDEAQGFIDEKARQLDYLSDTSQETQDKITRMMIGSRDAYRDAKKKGIKTATCGKFIKQECEVNNLPGSVAHNKCIVNERKRRINNHARSSGTPTDVDGIECGYRFIDKLHYGQSVNSWRAGKLCVKKVY